MLGVPCLGLLSKAADCWACGRFPKSNVGKGVGCGLMQRRGGGMVAGGILTGCTNDSIS